ncbi:Rossmann-fold NAD(P)-binding domain-containing protein [Paenibacillus xanthanilyticus]|uniref:Saccharopine dehydrogenase n=1 Tax=Paenibacillus xanthanilyticus TaxID=1783531 RepID=A0ABV8JZQ0_9BACL
MTQRLLIAGGYGIVGSAIARHVRAMNQEAEIVLAGRHPERGAALARQLGNARTAYLDVENIDRFDEWGAIDLIVSALQDPADRLIELALRQGIAHIGITKLADELAPLFFAAAKAPPKRAIVPLGHSQSGVMTLVALKTAEAFKQIDAIALAGLYDDREQMGPMTVGDAESFIGRALIRNGGQWAWVEASRHPRTVALADGSALEGLPMGLLDVPDLAAATGAPNVRFDFIAGESIGTRAGGQASQDLYIEIEGVLHTGQPAKRHTVVSDPRGQAHLTALGVLVAIERILGWDGHPAAAGGIHSPDTLVPVDAAIARFEQFGVRMFDLS